MRKDEQYYTGERLHTEVLEERYGKISTMTIRTNAWRKNKEISGHSQVKVLKKRVSEMLLQIAPELLFFLISNN